MELQLNKRAESIKNKFFKNKNDYVYALDFHFRKYIKVKGEIAHLTVEIEKIKKRPHDQLQLDTVQHKLDTLNHDLPIISDSIREIQVSFSENRKKMHLGKWDELLSAALSRGEFFKNENLNDLNLLLDNFGTLK